MQRDTHAGRMAYTTHRQTDRHPYNQSTERHQVKKQPPPSPEELAALLLLQDKLLSLGIPFDAMPQRLPIGLGNYTLHSQQGAIVQVLHAKNSFYMKRPAQTS